jgi:hypothetical protein
MINITYESVISHIFEIIALVFVPLIIIGCLYYSALGIYRFFKGKTKKELMEENARLLEENLQLKEKNAELSRHLEHAENVVILNEKQQKENDLFPQIIVIGSLRIQSKRISYIESQPDNSRMKDFHYTDDDKIDSVNTTFEPILEQLAGNFMQINKSQIVNLDEFSMSQGDELYLKGVNKAFYISDKYRGEFKQRTSKI